MFILSGAGAPRFVCVAFELIPFYRLGVSKGDGREGGGRGGGGTEAEGKSSRSTNYHTSKQGEVPPPFPQLPTLTTSLRARQEWQRAGACQDFPEFIWFCTEQMAHSDTAE